MAREVHGAIVWPLNSPWILDSSIPTTKSKLPSPTARRRRHPDAAAEAAAIPMVLCPWAAALPEAELVVFDNSSTDGSGHAGAPPRARGVRVVEGPDQGKGYAVRAIFADRGRSRRGDLVDGDGTYPAEEASGPLAADPRRCRRHDGRRTPTPPLDGAGAMARPIRGLGNVLIRAAFRLLIGRSRRRPPLGLHRVFSRHFLRSVHTAGARFRGRDRVDVRSLLSRDADGRTASSVIAAPSRRRSASSGRCETASAS